MHAAPAVRGGFTNNNGSTIQEGATMNAKDTNNGNGGGNGGSNSDGHGCVAVPDENIGSVCDVGTMFNPFAPKPMEWVRNPDDGSVLMDHNNQPVSVDRLLASKPLRNELCTRPGPGNRKLTYISGEGVSRTLNDIFGFDGWNLDITRVQREECTKDSNGRYAVVYTAQVKLTHKKSGTYKEDCGAGDSMDKNFGTAVAHALKGSITDAMKRAARHFGDKLGNALYEGKFSAKNAPVSLKDALDKQKIDRANTKFGFEKDRKAAAATATTTLVAAVPNTGPSATNNNNQQRQKQRQQGPYGGAANRTTAPTAGKSNAFTTAANRPIQPGNHRQPAQVRTNATTNGTVNVDRFGKPTQAGNGNGNGVHKPPPQATAVTNRMAQFACRGPQGTATTSKASAAQAKGNLSAPATTTMTTMANTNPKIATNVYKKQSPTTSPRTSPLSAPPDDPNTTSHQGHPNQNHQRTHNGTSANATGAINQGAGMHQQSISNTNLPKHANFVSQISNDAFSQPQLNGRDRNSFGSSSRHHNHHRHKNHGRPSASSGRRVTTDEHPNLPFDPRQQTVPPTNKRLLPQPAAVIDPTPPKRKHTNPYANR